MLKYKNNLVVTHQVEVLDSVYEFYTFIHLDKHTTYIVVTKNKNTIFKGGCLEDFRSIFINQLKQDWKNESRSKPTPERFHQYQQLINDTYNHYLYSFANLVDLWKQSGKNLLYLQQEFPYTYKRFNSYIGKI